MDPTHEPTDLGIPEQVCLEGSLPCPQPQTILTSAPRVQAEIQEGREEKGQ